MIRLAQWGLAIALASAFISWFVGLPLGPGSLFAFAMLCLIAFGSDNV